MLTIDREATLHDTHPSTHLPYLYQIRKIVKQQKNSIGCIFNEE